MPDFQKCHTLALLLPVGLSRAWIPSGAAPLEQPRASWKLSLDNPSPLSAPPRAAEITRTTMGAQPLHCGFLLSMYPFESTGLSSVLLTSQIPYQTVCLFIILSTCWRFLAPELSGQKLFFMFLHGQSYSVSQLSSREDIIFCTVWTAIKFGFIIFNYALKNIILGYFRFLVSFFPSQKKTVEIITKLSWDKKITDTEGG